MVWDGVNTRAHRVAYELLVGDIPDGRQLDHLCRVRNCVNPDHLDPVTSKINTLRSFSWAGINSRKTHCPQGHAYDERNTYVSPNGERCCRACGAERARRYRAEAKR